MIKQDIEINWKDLKDSNNIKVSDKIIVKHKKMTLPIFEVETIGRAPYQTKRDLLNAIKSYQLKLLEVLIYEFGEDSRGANHVISRGNICLQQKTLTFQ